VVEEMFGPVLVAVAEWVSPPSRSGVQTVHEAVESAFEVDQLLAQGAEGGADLAVVGNDQAG
jgi:hypothetical protein